jgi:hypothetical protein
VVISLTLALTMRYQYPFLFTSTITDGGLTNIIVAVNTPYCHPVVYQAVPLAPLFSRLLYDVGKTSGPSCTDISCKLLILPPSTSSGRRWWYWTPFWVGCPHLTCALNSTSLCTYVFLWLNHVHIEQQLSDNSDKLFIFVANCVTCFKTINVACQMLGHSWIALMLPIQFKWYCVQFQELRLMSSCCKFYLLCLHSEYLSVSSLNSSEF